MTRTRWLCAAVIAASMIGCGTQGSDPSLPGAVGETPIGVWPGHPHPRPMPPPGPGPACKPIGASGTAVSTLAIGGGVTLALDAKGNVLYTTGLGDNVRGIVKQTAAGARVYAFAHGSALAVDAKGDAYLAGSFTQPIDLGHGTMTPEGNIDVFVAKLSPSGKLMFSEQLGLCGDGVESIAVAPDGRIAVSGTSMGTVILDASGKLLEQLYFAGHLAFDPHGNLYVAGSFTGSLVLDSAHVLQAGSATDVDAFVAKVDVHGELISSLQLGDTQLPYVGGAGTFRAPLPQQIDAIAVNAKGDVALLGDYRGEISLFGKTLALPLSGPSGSFAGAFVAKLDATGHVVFAEGLGEHYYYNPTGSIAIGDDGRIAVSTNVPNDASYPTANPRLQLLDASGKSLAGSRVLDNELGYGLGVAFDACGNLEWADVEHTNVKLPLQPTLRLIAR